ncbi:hypothetical protein GZH46_00574 [Fragariocoptes setiger]|uniref:Uncharacterized protein n=1 Tax=Fragariocoptes setiger TaxID=1670756 RepID=A0ABQ7SBR3_9ACAR|nr:hypothetical protein GZH46_00574 [Fragariocoptes setiger]
MTTSGPAYSPDAGMGYMMDGSQQFRPPPGIGDPSGMGLPTHGMPGMGGYGSPQLANLRSPVHPPTMLLPGHHAPMIGHSMSHPGLPQTDPYQDYQTRMHNRTIADPYHSEDQTDEHAMHLNSMRR